MQILERDGTIGAKLLLNTEPDEIVRSVLAAMVTVKFSAEAARNLKRVSDAVMEVLKRRAIDSHGGLLFPNENGNKIAENHSRDRLKRLFSAVGIASTRRLHWHSWRNHFIIRCLDGGLGVHHIMKFTGHDSVRMVMRYADARTKENGFKAFKLLPPRQGRNGETANSLS
jgi:integrase